MKTVQTIDYRKKVKKLIPKIDKKIMKIKTIHQLAQEIQKLARETTTTEIYILHQAPNKPKANSVKRIAGIPIGVTPATWPHFEGTPMQHALTLDLAALPAVRTGQLTNARAVALFVSDFWDNEAFQPHTQESAVIRLSEEDIQQGEPDDILNQSKSEAYTYQVEPVTIPLSLFNHFEETQQPAALTELKNLLYSTSYAGGQALWMQDNEHQGHFLCQFDEIFVEMNLGDAGIMYMFVDTAFWQCA